MQYTEVTVTLSKLEPFRDLLTYALGDEGPYDSFQDTPQGLKAYVPTASYDETFLQERLAELRAMDGALECAFTAEALPDKDYNEEWERQHQAVLVENFCWVRAPFHPHRDDVKYEIVIEPKMSFGTAHHATTYLMLSYLEHEPLRHRRLLDMGSGTAVLAILAAMKGAAYVEAIDVDEWAYRNAQENIQRNGVRVTPLLGDAALLTPDKHFEVVLANINRNILLRDMEAYVRVLNPGGALIVSGFYEHDLEALTERARSLGLEPQSHKVREDWCAARFIKK